MAKKIFGLDIGTALIKAVFLDEKGGRRVLSSVGQRLTPAKGLRSESPLDLDLLSSTIKELVFQSKIDTKFVNVSLPESQVFTKVIDIPNLSDKELTSAIRFEAEQYVPSPLSEVVLDYQILVRPETSEKTMQVLLVAAPASLINKYRKILENADLIPFVFETETLSMVRALVLGKEALTMFLVNIGAASTTLAIVRRGALVFTYVVATGGNVMTRALSSDLSLEFAAAEEYKKTYGLEEFLQKKVPSPIEPIVRIILSEIQKGIKFYQEKYSQEEVRSVVLAGGGAKLPGLVPYIVTALSGEVEIANPWAGILVDEGSFKQALHDAPIFTTAVGLALRNYE